LFERLAPALNIEIKTHAVHFPEREVLLALSDIATLDAIVQATIFIELIFIAFLKFFAGFNTKTARPENSALLLHQESQVGGMSCHPT
jgi:hypothetical protein